MNKMKLNKNRLKFELVLILVVLFISSVSANNDSLLKRVEYFLVTEQTDSVNFALGQLDLSSADPTTDKLRLTYKRINSGAKIKSEDLSALAFRITLNFDLLQNESETKVVGDYFFKEIKKIYDPNEWDEDYAKLNWQISVHFLQFNQIDRANDINEQLLNYIALFEENTEQVQKAKIYANFHQVSIYATQNNNEQGLALCNKNVELAKSTNDTVLIINSLCDRTHFLINLRKADEFKQDAEYAIELGNNLKEKPGTYYTTVLALMSFCMVFDDMERYEELLSVLEKEKNYKDETQNAYADLLIKIHSDNRLEDTTRILSKFGASNVLEASEISLKIIDESPYKIHLIGSMISWAEVLVNFGYSNQGVNVFRNAMDEQKKIYSEELSKSIAQVETSKIQKIKEQEVELERQKTTYSYWIAGLIGIFLLIAILAFIRQRKQAKLLSSKNQVIEKTLGEKQLLLKEIHHRVKNNFQVISSLLGLQSRRIEDETAKTLADEGQQRIKSMAMIHERLYQNDKLIINFDDYTKSLVETLISSYQINKAIDVKFDMESIAFDVDTAIPLGLILNELITNAIKYGATAEHPNLNVSLKTTGIDSYELQVKDNGNGIPEGFDLAKARSLGIKLVKSLSRQLKGNVEFKSLNGTLCTINFQKITTNFSA